MKPTHFSAKNDTKFPATITRQENYHGENTRQHLEYELFYMEKGSGTMIIDKTEIPLTSGSTVFLPPNTNHFLKKTPVAKCGKDGKSAKNHKNGEAKAPFTCIVFSFDGAIIGNEDEPCRSFLRTIGIKYLLHIPDFLSDQLKTLSERKKEDTLLYKFLLKTFLMGFFYHIISTDQYEILTPYFPFRHNKVSAINEALHYIEEHYAENISLAEILEVTNYSKSHFIRLFKDSTKMNVTEYINKFRIEKSCRDLLYTDRNITEISTKNGFNNIQYFSRVFKQYMHCTPKEYRSKNKTAVDFFGI